MAILRCGKCGHIREVGRDYIGRSVKCPQCENTVTIYDTVAFLNALIKKHLTQQQELHTLRKDLATEETAEAVIESYTLDDININNTDIFTHDESYAPIVEWFSKRNIVAEIDPYAADTTGFFDEIALLIGNDFNTLNVITKQIKYIQNKGYKNAKIELGKKSPQEIQKLTSFCHTLHDYSFVSTYHYQKKDKNIHLTLQTAPKIRDFFNGIWMEWFALMKLLSSFREKQITPACSRNIKITFSDGSTNELDLFFLTEKETPVYIECKTGEFRQDIDKYLSLRKRLRLNKNQFIICVFGLSKEQAQGMTSMYDLTFVNEETLIDHIQTIT